MGLFMDIDFSPYGRRTSFCVKKSHDEPYFLLLVSDKTFSNIPNRSFRYSCNF